jgi:hypothetical protein
LRDAKRRFHLCDGVTHDEVDTCGAAEVVEHGEQE